MLVGRSDEGTKCLSVLDVHRCVHHTLGRRTADANALSVTHILRTVYCTYRTKSNEAKAVSKTGRLGNWALCHMLAACQSMSTAAARASVLVLCRNLLKRSRMREDSRFSGLGPVNLHDTMRSLALAWH